MIEFEWESKKTRADAAALLRQLADSLADGGDVELEQDGWELKVKVPGRVELGIEVEVGEDEAELEIELKWPRGGSAS